MTLRRQYIVALAKTETTDGVDAAPVASDAIAIETDSLQITIGNRAIDTSESTGSIDVGAPQSAGAPSTVRFRTRIRGAGQAYTGAVRPPLHPVLRACGLKDTLLAAVSTAVLTAGSATTGTLAAGFSSSAQAYRGAMLSITAGAAAHVGKIPLVTDYTAGRVATLAESYSPALTTSESFALLAQVVYAPVSDRVDIPAMTMWIYLDGLLYKFRGLKGSMSISATPGQPFFADITLTGIFTSLTDAAMISGASAVSIAAPIFAQGSALSEAFVLNRQALPIGNFNLDLGVDVQTPDDPNTTDGFGIAVPVKREMRLTIDPLMALIASRDMQTALRAGTQYTAAARAGTAAGNRLGITLPTVQPIERGEGDRSGLLAEQLTFDAAGANTGAFLAFS